MTKMLVKEYLFLWIWKLPFYTEGMGRIYAVISR